MLHKGWLRNAKVASAIGFLILIALIWWLGPWLGLKSVEARLGWIVAVMIVWVLALLIGQALGRRASGMLEGMLRRQADDAVINASADKRAEVTLLRQRLLGAIDTLKKSNLGSARGSAALYELPWYMIIGHPAAGKSSAILQSGLSFPFSDKSGIQGVGGTRNCDWFFSTEGVLLDTAGRYATESEDRTEWLAFLRLLKKHRAKAPVNGIMVAISLPELAQHNSEGFVLYARQVRERIHEVCNTFGLMVPIYLVFTKLDLLGGFAQFFHDAGEEERSRVWGATLSADQGTGFDAGAVVAQQFEQLYRGLVQMGEERLVGARGDAVKSAHFAFPIEFHGLQEAVVKFVRLLFEEDPYHSRPLLRGFYFTSALQEGVPRIVTAGRVQGQFDLSSAGMDKHQAPASYSYFLRGLFREVLFPDQHLIFQQTKPSGSRWRLAGMAAGLVTLAAVAGAWTWSFVGNQQMIAQVNAERVQAQKLAASGQLYDRLNGLLILQRRLEELQTYRRNGEPWQIGLGLYQGEELERNLRKAYFAGLKDVMLRPVQKNLETTLAALKPGAVQPVAVTQPPKPEPKPEAKPAPAPKPAKPYRPRPKHGLPNIQLGALEMPQRATTGKLDASAPAAGEAAAESGQPQKSQKLDVAYNALKTYLMLHDRRRMEDAHLADQLPRYWRPWLESQRGEYPVSEVMGQAEKLVAFYVSQIKEPDLPLIDNDVKVVADARDVLRGSFKQLSAQERVFNEIKARANTRFAPLTVARILDNRDMDIMASSQMVEGAYTREAWNTYVRAAIDEASKGTIRSDDWVLASSTQDDLGKDGDVEKNRAALEALYRSQYIAAWHKFLAGVVVRDIANPAQSASAMTRLADKQNSPIKLILARAAQETSWDNPSELNRSLETAKRSVLEKTTEFFKSGDTQAAGKNEKQYGVVGAHFAGVAMLVKGDNSPINSYLDQLAKLKVKMAAIATTDEPGPQARTALQSTLNGSGSELGDTLSYVDNTLLNGATSDTVEMVRPMLVRPLSQSYSALLGPVAQDINQAWANEVLPQWRQLASKYPFSDSNSSASVADISRFVKANDGTLDKFINKYLTGLVQKKGDELVPRAWGNQGVRFNPQFLSGVSSLMALANTQLQDGENSRFELQPLPTPGLSEIVLSIDGQELRYRNGPQQWQPFNWPGTNGEGARIQVVNYAGSSTVVGNQSGRMGLMRLLAGSKVSQEGDGSAQLTWTLPKGSGAEGQTVRFNFRMLGGVNPLQLNRLYKLTLPERVTL